MTSFISKELLERATICADNLKTTDTYIEESDEGTSVVEAHIEDGIMTILKVDFYDALAQEKRPLNIPRRRRPTGPPPLVPWCRDSDTYGHNWENPECDFDQCTRCGCTVIQARARQNMRKKH